MNWAASGRAKLTWVNATSIAGCRRPGRTPAPAAARARWRRWRGGPSRSSEAVSRGREHQLVGVPAGDLWPSRPMVDLGARVDRGAGPRSASLLRGRRHRRRGSRRGPPWLPARPRRRCWCAWPCCPGWTRSTRRCRCGSRRSRRACRAGRRGPGPGRSTRPAACACRTSSEVRSALPLAGSAGQRRAGRGRPARRRCRTARPAGRSAGRPAAGRRCAVGRVGSAAAVSAPIGGAAAEDGEPRRRRARASAATGRDVSVRTWRSTSCAPCVRSVAL